jgi:hypothetical protein
MEDATERYTNFYRDKAVWTGTLVSGKEPVEPNTMAEAIAEIVTLDGTNPDLVYWNTVVEQDNPDGTTIVTVIDLCPHARDVLRARKAASEASSEASGEISWKMVLAA